MSNPTTQNSSQGPSQSTYEFVDVEALRHDRPLDAVKTVTKSKPDLIVGCDLLIVGGGTGGVAAALRALKPRQGSKSLKVCLTEETSWLGGQMTAQGVSALDENYLVETSGACRSYQTLRESIRRFYREERSLTPEAQQQQYLNPGNCWVTRLAFEPQVVVDILAAQMKPFIDNGQLALYPRHKAVYVRDRDPRDQRSGTNGGGGGSDNAGSEDVRNSVIEKVGIINLDTHFLVEFHPRLILDATELGDLLPISGLAYQSGVEAHALTKERHAPEKADSENVQDFTYPFVLEFRPGESHRIEKPAHYDEFASRGKFSFDGYKMFETSVIESGHGARREVEPFWTYRRLIDRELFLNDPHYPADIAMINWDSNDLRGYNLIDKDCRTQAERLALGKAVSLCFLYWLQNEAPRDDGGKGYPELSLRKDVLGTADGLSKYPYIRESRRIVAFKTVTEEAIVAATNNGARAAAFDDSVGIGLYPVDIHGKQDVPGAGQNTRPFQVPLGALIPQQRLSNLLPAGKNIGVTHVTNGAYRLHPIEWAIGEAQGALSQILLDRGLAAQDLLLSKKLLRELQNELIAHGAPVIWYDDVPTDHPDFAAIQFLTVSGIIAPDPNHLHFRPDESITRGEAALSLHKVMAPRRIYPTEISDITAATDLYTAAEACVAHGLFDLTENKEFRPDLVLTKTEFDQMSGKLKIAPDKNPHEINDPLLRTEFASAIYPLAISKAPVVRR